jgi:hypothetical protein
MAEPVYFTPVIPASDVYPLTRQHWDIQYKLRAAEYKNMVIWMARKIAIKVRKVNVKGLFASLIEAGKTKQELAIEIDKIPLEREDGSPMMASDYGYWGPNKDIPMRRLISELFPTLDVASVFINDISYVDKFHFRLVTAKSFVEQAGNHVPAKTIILKFYPDGLILERFHLDRAIEIYNIQVAPPEPPVEVAVMGEEKPTLAYTEDPETGEIFFTFPATAPATAPAKAAGADEESQWGGDCSDSICMCHDDTLKAILGKTVLGKMEEAAGCC